MFKVNAKNVNRLKLKEIGLFICCKEDGGNAQKQLLNAFPGELIRNAKAPACFGGEFDFGKMNFFQKMIVKKWTKYLTRFWFKGANKIRG